jgi:immunoglobulin-like protein involved in spore germination/sporulation and spore germination protein
VKLRALTLALALAFTAGCGGGDDEVTPTDTGTTPTTADTVAVRVYFLREGKVWPARREFSEVDDLVGQALNHLLIGPTEQEKADLDFTTAIPAGGWDANISIGGGVVQLDFAGVELPREAVAQVVYTVSQLPLIESVEIDGKRHTPSDFEDLTPAIMVESPLPFEEVASPLRVTGTANTFEANFQYELTDTDGLIVDQNFVTATSGTGTRGTFDFTTNPFTVPFDGVGALIVLERSAKDGSRINLVEIPLRMKR